MCWLGVYSLCLSNVVVLVLGLVLVLVLVLLAVAVAVALLHYKCHES